MITKKLIVAIVLFLVLVFALSSCEETIPPPDPNLNSTPNGKFTYTVVDGMPCLIWTRYHQGGITCDWDEWVIPEEMKGKFGSK